MYRLSSLLCFKNIFHLCRVVIRYAFNVLSRCLKLYPFFSQAYLECIDDLYNKYLTVFDYLLLTWSLIFVTIGRK